MSEWISIKDRLPNNMRVCFACNRAAFSKDKYAYLYKIVYYDSTQFRSIYDGSPTEITHWMYPPKVRDEDG